MRYLRAYAETLDLPPGGLDLVASSLHYVADYPGLVRRIARWLRPGGHLVYSIEHPICTGQDPMTGWLTTGGCALWPVDAYAHEAARIQPWLGVHVIKYHRRLTTLITGLTTAGLTISGIDEPHPSDAVLARRPDLAQHRLRPPLLLVSARKPANLA